MKYFSILLIFFFSMSLYGQSYRTTMIIDKADSILKSRVGDNLRQYFKYDTSSYYKYKGFNNKSHFPALSKSKRTKGKFIEAEVRFYFKYPLLKEISGITQVKFDNNLKLIDSLYLDFIPDFLWHNRQCDFISSETALKIALDSLKEKGLYEIKPILHLDYQSKRYVYEFDNTLKEDKHVNEDKIVYIESLVEVLRVDAITKEVIYHDKKVYGSDYYFEK